jgi:hypothetical protein
MRHGPLPSDAVTHAQTTSWRASVSVERQVLVVETLDYHAGPLHLTIDDLRRALAALETKKTG